MADTSNETLEFLISITLESGRMLRLGVAREEVDGFLDRRVRAWLAEGNTFEELEAGALALEALTLSWSAQNAASVKPSD